jgi:hypothetical protein
MTSLEAKHVDARYSTFNDFTGGQINYVSMTQTHIVQGDATARQCSSLCSRFLI